MCISRTEKPATVQVLEIAPSPHRSRYQHSNPSRRLARIAAELMLAASLAGVLLQAACVVGPKYARPSVPSPPAYKELSPEASQAQSQWKIAQPDDAAIRSKWWEAFRDPQLNELEEKAGSSNQNIAAAAANFLAARALVRQARSQYFPTASANPSIMNSRTSPGQLGGITGGSSGLTIKTYTDYSLPFDASWEPDFWGRVRSTVRANVYAAQASAADLESVRLSEQAELAVDYYELRAQDSLKQLLDSTVAAYQETLALTQSQYRAGLCNDEGVAQAEAQLRSAQAQDTDLGVLRAQYEHAIAVLIGQPASTFSLPAQALEAKSPAIPVGVPSELLERRPDIAAAERSARLGPTDQKRLGHVNQLEIEEFPNPPEAFNMILGKYAAFAYANLGICLGNANSMRDCAGLRSSSIRRIMTRPWRITGRLCSPPSNRWKTTWHL